MGGPRRTMMLLLLGAPGVGKGTYGSILARKLGFRLLGAGAVIRDEVQSGSAMGQELAKYADKGELVPSALVTDMVMKRVDGLKGKGIVLDGFPRSIEQAKSFDASYQMDLVVNLELRREEYLIRKLLGRRICSCGKSFNVAHVECESEGVFMPALLPRDGNGTICDCGKPLERRSDDTDEVIRRRLAVYEKETSPLVSHYDKQGVLERFTILRGLEDVPSLEELITTSFKKSSSG